MKTRFISVCAIVVAMIMGSGCASIVSKTSYPLIINTRPSDATISIVNSSGAEVYKGTSPANVMLKASEGYFKKASYLVTFTKDGYDEKVVPVHCKVDGWYWGNIVFGGLIGFLIVDPATGAMYKLETEFVSETLTQSSISKNQPELRIYGMTEIPPAWKSHLVSLNRSNQD